MNLQVEQLLKSIPAKERKVFRNIDNSISGLYISGYINRAAMERAREKLIRKILTTNKAQA